MDPIENALMGYAETSGAGYENEIGYEEIGVDEMGRRILRPVRRGGGARPRVGFKRPALLQSRAGLARQGAYAPQRQYNPNLPPVGGPNLTADRLFPLPCNSAAAIAAAGTGNAQCQPQADCKPVRYVVHAVYDTNPAVVPVAAWLINWIQIGQRLQAIANGGAMADMFGFNAVATGIEFDTAQMNQLIVANVTDTGGITAGKTAIFRSTFLCKALHY